MLTSTCCKTVRKESTISVTFKTHRKKSVWGGHGDWKEVCQHVNSCYW